PICTPLAPKAKAAAIARPSAIPPAAITGTRTASTICGTSAMEPTTPAPARSLKLPRCPPASNPCAMMTSAPVRGTGVLPMMGERQSGQEALFYEFSLERHVPAEHVLRSIDQFVELDGMRCELAPFYSEIGRPSIDPELMIRMLIVGYCFGIRSERRLCE